MSSAAQEESEQSREPRQRRSAQRRRSSFFSPSPPPPSAGPKDFLEFNNDLRHLSMLRNLHMADYITLMNGWCGFNSLISSLRYALTGETYYIVRAMYLVPLGLFFDFMDGRVARWRKKSSLMGQELDSLADLVSFGVAPAIIGFSLGLRSTLDVLVLTLFVLCGLTRLARFNVTVANIPKDSSGKSKYFEGTPIPTTLVIIGIWYYLINIGSIGEDLPFGSVVLLSEQWFGSIVEVHPIVLMYFASGCAMVSKSLKVPKL